LNVELTQREAQHASLQESYDRTTKKCRELEEELANERESHQTKLQELQHSLAEQSKATDSRQATFESELITLRQQCEGYIRTKAELQDEVGEAREKCVQLEAALQERRSDNEKLSLEIEQAQSQRDTASQKEEAANEKCRGLEATIKNLETQVRVAEQSRTAEQETFEAKVAHLDKLLNDERSLRESAEANSTTMRRSMESEKLQRENDERKASQELLEQVSTWKDKCEGLEAQLESLKEQSEQHRQRAEDLDDLRRSSESQLKTEVSNAEEKARRFETEKLRISGDLEALRTELGELQVSSQKKVSDLQRELDALSTSHHKTVEQRSAVEQKLQEQQKGQSWIRENLRMATEELTTRKVEFALDKQRLTGALEESRRTLRNSFGGLAGLGTTSPETTAKVTRLEGMLAEERKKACEQMVRADQYERLYRDLQETSDSFWKRQGEKDLSVVKANKQVETLREELKVTSKERDTLAMAVNEEQERRRMMAAEWNQQFYTMQYESQRMTGAITELRRMVKAQMSEAKA